MTRASASLAWPRRPGRARGRDRPGARSADQAHDRHRDRRRQDEEVPARGQPRPRPQHGRGVRLLLGRRHAGAGVHAGRAGRCCSAISRSIPTGRWLWIPTGMLVGGAIGNLIDRIANGAVTDFIKLPHWPAFNVADMSITFGVLALCGCSRAASGRAARRTSVRSRRPPTLASSCACPTRPPASGWTASWPSPLGSRARAQCADRRRSGPGRRRRRAQAPPRRGRRGDRGRRRASPNPDRVPDQPARRSRSPTRTSTCWSSTSPPASSCTRPGATGGHAGSGAGRARRRRRGALAGRDRAPPRPRHLGPARRGQERLGAPRAEGRCSPRGACAASIWPWSTATRPPEPGRSTRRSGATAVTGS